MGVRDERGMVTAETAVLAPFAVVIGLLLVWVVSLGVTQVRLVDAAREGARVAARGQDPDAAEQAARRVAPGHADVRLEATDGLVTVTVSTTAGPPLPFLRHVGEHELEATSVAAAEQP